MSKDNTNKDGVVINDADENNGVQSGNAPDGGVVHNRAGVNNGVQTGTFTGDFTPRS